MRNAVKLWTMLLLSCYAVYAHGEYTQRVVDIPTRPGVTQRMLVLTPQNPKAVVILFAGGHGGLQLSPNGVFKWGEGNFLIRSRQIFADQELLVAVVDAPSDRQSSPYLAGFRQTPEHVADVKAVIAWVREQAKIPVWLIGTSRGTQSVAFVAAALTGEDGPDGLVLTSTILSDEKSRAVPAMPLGSLHIPVLVVHHEQDGCKHCAYSGISTLMEKLGGIPKKQLISMKGGEKRGDPCEAFAYHGFNGLEHEVVTQIASWILAK